MLKTNAAAWRSMRLHSAHSAHTTLLATAQRAPRRSAFIRTLWERCKDATPVWQGFKDLVYSDNFQIAFWKLIFLTPIQPIGTVQPLSQDLPVIIPVYFFYKIFNSSERLLRRRCLGENLDGRPTTREDQSQKLTMSPLCTGELKQMKTNFLSCWVEQN